MADLFNKIAEEVQLATDELQSLISGAISLASEVDETTSDFDASGGMGSSEDEFDLSDLDLDGMSEEEIQQMLAEEFMQHNPLQGIAEGVTQEIMAGQAQPQNFAEHFAAFRSAITWSEKFILGLIAFQVIMFFLCLYVSQRDRGLAPKLALMSFIFIVVRSAEWLNTKGEEHWESFATQDYFDKRGIFVTIMLCAPLVLDVLMMLLFFMKEASSLLVEVKRTEIQRKRQKEKENGGGKKKAKGRSKTQKQD